MSVEQIRNQLLQADLHEESVNRLVEAYKDMQFYLANGKYQEAGTHVGNFCENLANIVLDETGEGVNPHIQVGNFVRNITSDNYDTDGLDDSLRLLIPRMMQAVYDFRNRRDSVHVNLEVPVNHSDTQTAVRCCTWMLSELLRVYSDEDDLDGIAELIEDLAAPLTPYIDSYNGKHLVMSRKLDLEEELLIHLHVNREVSADDLTEWVLEADGHTVKSTLGNMKRAKKIHYEDGIAKITPLGVEEAEEIISEQFPQGGPASGR